MHLQGASIAKVDYSKKGIAVADLDGTLVVSKTPMDDEMQSIIGELLEYMAFAVISGGKYEIFQKNFVSRLKMKPDRLSRLYIFPTCGAAFYAFKNGKWTGVYEEVLTQEEKDKVMRAFEIALKKAKFEWPAKPYGEVLEDRGTQITFSAYGQLAPVEVKAPWDPDMKKRMVIRKYLQENVPEFQINIGGMTSIDVTRRGINKAYGIMKITEVLGYSIDEMVYLGDALQEGGNDYPVKAAGVDCIAVSGPEEAKKVLRDIIKEKKKEASGK